MEALELDEEMRRLEADPSGPMSSDELALLRAENALLKKKLKALEKGGRGDKPGL